MSLIGPRPLLVQYLPRYNEEQHHRHDVRPGLTGYAQAHGRNAVSWEEKFAMDVWYVNHVSIKTDIKVILDTVKTVMKKEGISSDTSVGLREGCNKMMEKDAKIYVAGHKGMVGSAIVRELNRQGYNNIVTRTHKELDLTRQGKVEEFFIMEKPEYVFMPAGKVGGILANQNALADFMYENMMMEMNVINSAWRYGSKKLEFLGSSCIYPRLAPQPMSESCLLTSELEKTNEAYALAKISGLKYCEFLNKQYGTDYISVMPGVRYSITNPDAYIESNLIGFYNILEACRHSYDNGQNGVQHLVYASSSSVYGSNKKVPYSTDDKVDNPVSLYAATKKSNELMAHAYSKLYNIPSTGLRFFTVYGPAGRPDMAYFGFTNKLRNNEKIQIFNYGNCKRDFTYIDDIVEGVMRVMQAPPEKKIGEDGLPIPPYAVYNIGNNHPENLLEFVDILQQELIRAGVLPEDYDFDSHKELVPMQPGDVPVTYADTSALERDFGFKPSTDLRTGLRKFAEWYKEFYM